MTCKIKLPTEYERIRSRIGDLYRELNTGDYDRAETRLHGIEIRVWRTRINTTEKTHLGYKPPWERRYTKTSKLSLIEFLYARKNVND